MPQYKGDYTDLVKVLFQLERDENGWPPIDVEGMWAKKIGTNEYVVYNTPFYVRGIAIGDVILAGYFNGELYYSETLREGGHGTIRVLLKSAQQMDSVVAALESFGSETELAEPRLIAADVRPGVSVAPLLAYLDAEQAASRLSYEVGCKSW